MNKNKVFSKIGIELLICVALSAVTAFFCYFILFYGSIVLAEHAIENFQYITFLEETLSTTERIIYENYINSIQNLCLFASFILFIFTFLVMIGTKIQYIKEIVHSLSIIQNGSETERVPEKGKDELNILAVNINNMIDRIAYQQEKEKLLQAQNKQIIMDLAHDIRTPLTSIMSYIEFIKSGKYSENQEKEYLNIAYEKSEQIKQLTDKLFDKCKEDFKADSFSSEKQEMIDAKLLFSQILFEIQAYLQECGFDVQIKNNINDTVYIKTETSELNRVFDNIISNILKYADKNKKVIFDVKIYDSFIIVSQKNSILQNFSGETNGIGLKNIKYIIESFGGKVLTEKNNSEFCIDISLPFHKTL